MAAVLISAGLFHGLWAAEGSEPGTREVKVGISRTRGGKDAIIFVCNGANALMGAL
jgi:hypothetical protein